MAGVLHNRTRVVSSADAAALVYSPNYATEIIPPSVHYTRQNTRITDKNTHLGTQNVGVQVKAAFVKAGWRRRGMRYLYSLGGVRIPLTEAGDPGTRAGAVRSSAFQQIQNSLHNQQFNDTLYTGGYPRNLGLTFRVATLPKNNVTGGSTNARPGALPRFDAVQTILRYSAAPKTYPTKSSRA